MVIKFAHAAGIRTINVVRRAERADELLALGADHVLIDADAGTERTAELTGGVAVALALDAVGGRATGSLLSALAPGGVLVSYGDMSGQPSVTNPADLIFGRRSIRGFNVGDWFANATPAAIADLYGTILGQLVAGDPPIPIEATYPLTDTESALRHAAEDGRAGKILLVGSPL
ncbi:hypothetical protein DSM112329_03645 [Paraconexibacter sp. AEG42_29]|uniref:Alcohol dehydrogenase-like C-terminal domain-containing protein n=1 Tax=Paraconexibacter sp. AEG42_29 TaxID=2997339 RepID=A0AAU7AYR1_9ACTN